MTSLWPFVVWGIDLIGRLPKGRSSVQYAEVIVNYFTKWVEAKALVSITPTKIKKFVYKNIVCQYRVPHTIVLDQKHNSTATNSRSFATTSKSRRSSRQSGDLRLMGRLKL